MPLFVDLSGTNFQAELDVAGTADGDSGNVSFANFDGTADQVSYAQSASGFGQDRLTELIGLGSNLVVTGVDSSFVLSGTPITSVAGATFVDGSGIIRCVYDTTQCGGSGYFVFDTGGHKIVFPGVIVIAHEMSHGFHIGNGDLDSGDPEFQAETDENGYRAQNFLPLRDPHNHGGGCGPPDAGGGGGGGGGAITCLIATAACGSADAPQLYNVRRLRDVVLRRSVWGAELFEGVHQEYYRFSPQVSACMNRSPEVREALSVSVVEPYFAFLAVLEAHATLGNGAAAVARGRIDRFLSQLPKGGIRGEHAGLIRAGLSALKGRLREGPPAGDPPLARFQSPAEADAMDILGSLCAVVEAGVPAGGYVEWALLDPLILFWESVSEPGRAPARLMAGLDDWIRAAPLPSCYASLDGLELGADLRYLKEVFFTSAPIRATIARRLLHAHQPRSLRDLPALLEASGYLIADEAA